MSYPLFNNSMFSENFVSQVQSCDTLFADIDTVGDNQLSFAEFEAYIKKRNPNEEDREDVMKEFKAIDTSGDGHIQFLEFLRAVCKKNGVYMHKELNSFEKV